MTKVVLDIETDGLDATQIHCIVARSYKTGQELTWVGEECKNFNSWSRRKDLKQFIMHNGISFDAPVLNRLTGSAIKIAQIRDTLLESQLLNPIREEGHSLEAWGKKLSFEKGEFKEFSEYNEDMLEYCKRDVELTHKLALTLEKEKNIDFQKAYDLESRVRTIIDQQQINGFAFNVREASILHSRLEDEQSSLEKKSKVLFPPEIIETISKVRKVRNKKEIIFNIASRKQIADKLKAEGWEPTEKTEKDNIIINEAVLNKIIKNKKSSAKLKSLAEMFNRYFLLQKRTGLLKGWFKECDEDDRVRGKVLTLRTITGRMAHNNPNMAQVPAVYSPYGKECRSLWTVSNPDTHSLVGTDASGLELRCLAHYMDDTKFTDAVLSGDVHTANQEMAGLKTRDQAKTFIYAFLYGAGPAKIGKIVGGSAGKGQNLIKRFLSNMPALKKLRDDVHHQAAKEGTILGLDDRRLHIRHEHAALNTLIQGAGAIVCKQWLVHLIDKIEEAGLDAKLVASVHDEYQFEVLNKDTRRFGELTKEAIQQATQTLEMNCALDCDYKVGKTWADTH